jgi:hypothetical protein
MEHVTSLRALDYEEEQRVYIVSYPMNPSLLIAMIHVALRSTGRHHHQVGNRRVGHATATLCSLSFPALRPIGVSRLWRWIEGVSGWVRTVPPSLVFFFPLGCFVGGGFIRRLSWHFRRGIGLKLSQTLYLTLVVFLLGGLQLLGGSHFW